MNSRHNSTPSASRGPASSRSTASTSAAAAARSTHSASAAAAAIAGDDSSQQTPPSSSSPAAAASSAVPALFEEFLKDDEIDLSDEISDDSAHDGQSSASKNTPLREQDRFLPIANIAKIMKRAIPDNGKIAKDSRECIQECVSEFISFITSEASDRCCQEKRKTINGDDILFAMLALGFDHYAEPLTLYLHKYRETTKSDRSVVGGGASGGGEASTAAQTSGKTSGGGGEQPDDALMLLKTESEDMNSSY